MALQAVALVFLAAAIVLGFTRKINVGLVSLGLSFILSLIGNVGTGVIFSGFPGKLFLTLLGTMFFFCLLQDNHTLELLSKKMVALVGRRTFLIPPIIYLVSYLLSAAGPGAISVQSVMIIFAVSLAVQMGASPVLMGSMAILGAVGGTTSPIALSGIIVTDLTSSMGMENAAAAVFAAVSGANLICAVLLYIVYKGYRLRGGIDAGQAEAFSGQQKVCLAAVAALVVLVVGFQFDVGLVAFMLSLVLTLLGVVNEKAGLKLVPWSVLLLICGVSVLMEITKELGGIELLSELLASLMNEKTASAVIGLTAGIMSWFSSANGVVLPTLIPTAAEIAASVGGQVTALEMVAAIVGGATVAGISPLSTGGSLVLASYVQEVDASEKEQQRLFARLFAVSLGAVLVMVIVAFLGGFRLFG